MPEQAELERSYRRLLLAYPRFYRHERGLEILTTLLDAAKPGQVRATLGETTHLILSGLRLRLVPPGLAGKIAAGVAALWTAVVLSGVGAYAAWGSPAAEQPALDNPETITRSDSLVGRPPGRVSFGETDPLHMAYTYKAWGQFQTLAAEDLPGVRPVPGGHTRIYPKVDAAHGVLTEAHRRLADDGWQTGAFAQPDDCACGMFWASRDGLLLRLSEDRESDGRSAVVIAVHRVEPGGVLSAAIAGFVLGLVVSWPVMTWLTHRFTRTPREDRMLVLLFGIPALYACAANTVDNVLSMVPDPDTDSMLLAADLMYPLANQIANPLAASVIVVGLIACAGIVVFTPWHRHRPQGDSVPSDAAAVEG
ncbi:hypothetical protein [Catellatospora sichuanensis]|uniref:hypothetical protein n=1 Tax=Catellatospora sichuanensis TaxID=1969805 RepID=UPI001182276C|nr:hypothetical protein [Catellatospora sichuanensis]